MRRVHKIALVVTSMFLLAVSGACLFAAGVVLIIATDPMAGRGVYLLGIYCILVAIATGWPGTLVLRRVWRNRRGRTAARALP